MEAVMNFSDPLTWLFYFTVMAGMAMAVFGNAGVAFLGIFILFINASILQSNEQKASDIRFVYEQFEQGQVIECGLWRGSSTIADPARGWVLQDGRFVKEDTVLSDPSLCRVAGKEFPQASWLGSLLLFFVITGLALLARLGVSAQEGRSYWSGTKMPTVSETAASDEAKGE